MIKVRKYTAEDKFAWDTFVKEAKNATFLFQRDFMDYHKDRFEDFSILCFKKDVLFAVLPANKKINEVFSHQGLSYGGLLVKQDLSSENYIIIMKYVLQFLNEQQIISLQIKRIPRIYYNAFSEEENLCLQLLKAERLRVDSYYVIDNKKEYKPNRNRRRALKVAVKKGLSVKENRGLDFFWEEILIKNLQDRFQVKPVHNISEIKALQKKLPKAIRFYGAYNDNELKAGVLMFLTKQVAHFQYSSGSEDRSDDGALDFLFDFIIKKYSDREYVSFGSSSQNRGLQINAGLAYWKESFGARMHTQDHYKILTDNHQLLNSVFI